MKIVIIVQARMTSTRLPGKVLKTVLDKPLLEYQVERLRQVKLADQIIIATTINYSDQPILDLCDRLSVPFYRGSEEDVLSRYYEAAMQFQADTIVRITSDCPLIDPEIIDRLIDYYQQNYPNFDYVSNSGYSRGMDVEIFSTFMLQKAYINSVKSRDREHVTPYFYSNPNLFRLGIVESKIDSSQYRLTVDTLEDFQLIEILLSHLKPQFTLKDIIMLLEKNPNWVAINSHILQKALEVNP